MNKTMTLPLRRREHESLYDILDVYNNNNNFHIDDIYTDQ